MNNKRHPNFVQKYAFATIQKIYTTDPHILNYIARYRTYYPCTLKLAKTTYRKFKNVLKRIG